MTDIYNYDFLLNNMNELLGEILNMEILKEFYETNKEWLDRLFYALISALMGYLTAMFQTRKSRLESLVDGINVYDDNDLVWIQGDYKDGAFVPLSQLSVVKKGKNADEKISK